MFAYSDPSGTGVLENAGAIDAFRQTLHEWYDRLAALDHSGFTWIEAFDELSPGAEPQHHEVTWRAFPITAAANNDQIDADRFRWQDEYVEWRVERPGGNVVAVTFTTEFPEYFEALAQAGVDALKEEVAALVPDANPTDAELFGPGPDPAGQSPRTRARRFRQNLQANPWNNGDRGILCLAQSFNTLGALFNLLGHCGIDQPNLEPGQVCGKVGGFCGPNRNSDPNVCAAAQGLVRAARSFTASDPAGIFLKRLDGDWRRAGELFDINADPAWALTRKGRRGVLQVTQDLTLDHDPVTSGAMVSKVLVAGSAVMSAADAGLPDWARVGQEQTRGPIA